MPGRHARGARSWRSPLSSALSPGLAVVAVTIAGCVIAGLPLAWPHRLGGAFSYDEGVYAGSAVALAHGLVPYRDFALVQPPGITVLLLPISAVARLVGAGTGTVLAAGRVLTALVEGATAGLAAAAVRHRGAVAALVAGTAVACFPLAYTADSSALLEPFVNLFCLGGLVLLFRRGEICAASMPYLAGCALGVACAVKLWALMPAAVLLVASASASRRVAGWLAAGVITGAVVVTGPFLVIDAPAFVRDVVLAQANRVQIGAGTLSSRLDIVTGLRALQLSEWWLVPMAAGWLALEVVVHARRRPDGARGRLLDLCLGATTVGMLAVMALAVPFYGHYAVMWEPWPAMLLGSLAGRAVRSLSPAGPAPAGGDRAGGVHRRLLRLHAAVPGVAVLLALAIGTGAAVGELDLVAVNHVASDNAAIVAYLARLPPTTCVVSDEVEVLLASGRMPFGSAGCPLVVDSYGTELARRSGARPAGANRALDRSWEGWLGKARYVYFTRRYRHRIPWSPQIASWFRARYAKVALHSSWPALGALYERRGPPGVRRGSPQGGGR